jgi:uncharacterized protein (TIGR00255 family)
MATHSLKSMTGYAQARVEQDGWALRISLRSVNHRFLDLHLRMPDGFEVFEPRIRQAVRDRLRRGHVDVTVHYEPAGPAAVHVHRDVAAAYLSAAEEIRKQFGLQGEPDLAAILRLPGVIGSTALPSEEEAEALGRRIASCLEEALARLEEMRRSEGRHLAEEMSARLRAIAEHATRIEELAERVRPAYARRMETRLRELMGAVPVEPARVAQEAALLAERGDICEEISRLHSHVQQFEKLLAGPGEAGKKLDFLLQEMQREANTMLSKTPGVEADGLAITELALEVKSQIEKLREQVQNIE